MMLAASGQPAISMTWPWWPGLVRASSRPGAIAEGPGGVGRQIAVLGGGVQVNASGFDALGDRGQGFAGVPQ